MTEIQRDGQNPEPRIILIRDGEARELTGPTDQGVAVLSVIRAALIAAIDGNFVKTTPFLVNSPDVSLQPVSEQAQKAPEAPAKPDLELADLKTPNHFRQYFIYSLGMFLGEEPKLPLPSQEHVDRGNRIKDAGFTTYKPVACPELTIVEGYQYPENWKFQLDSWIYKQIANRNLAPGVLNLKKMYGWLDVSPGLDWKSGDPMFDPNTDKPLVDLLKGFRAKGKRGGIEVVDWCKQLAPGSLYGISADETRNVVYPALAKILGAHKEEVRNLKTAELSFIGNYLYFGSNGEINLGGANSWVWLDEDFGAGGQLIGGSRGDGGLSGVSRDPSGNRHVSIRLRPLVVSPSAA